MLILFVIFKSLVALVSLMAWIFLVMFQIIKIYEFTDSKGNQWWSFPLYMALELPLSVAGIGGIMLIGIFMGHWALQDLFQK